MFKKKKFENRLKFEFLAVHLRQTAIISGTPVITFIHIFYTLHVFVIWSLENVEAKEKHGIQKREALEKHGIQKREPSPKKVVGGIQKREASPVRKTGIQKRSIADLLQNLRAKRGSGYKPGGVVPH